MFSYEVTLAALLLTGGDHVPDKTLEPWFEPLHIALRAVAVEAEVLDAREFGCHSSQPTLFVADVRILQGRWRDLFHAPLVEECWRFPNRDQIGHFLAFNRAYRRDLVHLLSYSPLHAEELKAMVAETDRLFRAWDSLRNAQSECYYVFVRRGDLLQLRDMIGYEAFYSGQMPPHVPTWRFAIGP